MALFQLHGSYNNEWEENYEWWIGRKKDGLFKIQLFIHFDGLSRTKASAILACLGRFESERSAKLEILRGSGSLRSFILR